MVNEEGTRLLVPLCDHFNRKDISTMSFWNMRVTNSLQRLPCTSTFGEIIETQILINS